MGLSFYIPTTIPPIGGIDEYTKLMLHMDGIDDGTSFTDDSGSSHVITTNGSAVTKTSVKQFGTASGLFNSVNNYLTVPDSEDWTLGTIYTIDTWVYIITGNQINYFLAHWQNTDNKWAFGVNASNLVTFNIKTGGTWSTPEPLSSGTCPIGEWVHLAVVADGSNLKIYINGTNDGSYTNRTIADRGGLLYVGKGYESWYLRGYLDETRVSKGIARWTANFTPETGPYTE